MKKSIFMAFCALLAVFSSCSSENDDPKVPTDDKYTYPIVDNGLESNLSWLQEGEANIEFIDAETQVLGITRDVVLYDQTDGKVSYHFNEGFDECKIVSGQVYVSNSYERINLIPGLGEIELPSVGNCMLTNDGISFNLINPEELGEKVWTYSVELYIQGFKNGKDFRGYFTTIVYPEKIDVGNSMTLQREYLIKDSEISAAQLAEGVLRVPAEGGKIILSLDRSRTYKWVKIEEKSFVNNDEGTVGDVVYESEMAEYHLDSETGDLMINVKPNTLSDKRINKVKMQFSPSEIDIAVYPHLLWIDAALAIEQAGK